MSAFLAVFITVLYPLAIWLGHDQVEPRLLAGLVLLAGLTRLTLCKIKPAARWYVVGTLLLVAAAVIGNALLPLKLYPVLVSATMLGAFAFSLIFPPSMVERIARLREPDLPAEAVGYTRCVTQVWCIFFVVNGFLALVTALWASPSIWALYNGLIAYLLMGLLLAGEYVVRCQFKRRLCG